MKIQGIEILRITDFRRFFDMEDFLVNAKDYADFFRDVDLDLFCNKKEALLLSQIRAWCLGFNLNATFVDDQISLVGDNWIPLGEISKVLNDFQDSISYQNRIMLAYLLLLFKNTWSVEEMRIACQTLQNFKDGAPLEEYNSLHKNIVFSPAKFQTTGIVRRFFMNTKHPEGLTVSCGDCNINLQPGDCVVGLFNRENECVRLLPNIAASEDKKIRMKLKVNLSTGKPYVKIIRADKTEEIEDVASFWIEPDNYVIILTNTGNIVLVNDDGKQNYPDKCFKLRKRHEMFKQSHENKTIVAIEPTQWDYVFYSI